MRDETTRILAARRIADYVRSWAPRSGSHGRRAGEEEEDVAINGMMNAYGHRPPPSGASSRRGVPATYVDPYERDCGPRECFS